MKNKRRILLLVILVMAIGFAAVSTTLYINGTVGISSNLEDFEEGVIFTKASTTHGDAKISEDGKTITYKTGDLSKIGGESILNFTIKNKSHQYDAEAIIKCFAKDKDNIYNNNVTFIPNTNKYIINSGSSTDGFITITLIKPVTEDASVEFVCEILATAKERTTPGIVFDYDAEQFAFTGNKDLECEDIQCALTKLNELMD